MAFALELAAQLFEVINLAVVRNPNRAVLVRHRHMAVCGKVEDGKAPAAQTKERAVRGTMLPQPAVVRPTMRLNSGHPRQCFAISPVRKAANAAHMCPRPQPARSDQRPKRGSPSSLRTVLLSRESTGSPEIRNRSAPALHPESRAEAHNDRRKARRTIRLP